MSSTLNPRTFPIPHCSTRRLLMAELFSILLRNMYEITLLGDRLTVNLDSHFLFCLLFELTTWICLYDRQHTHWHQQLSCIHNTAFCLVQQGNQTTTEAHAMLRVSRLLAIYKKQTWLLRARLFWKGTFSKGFFTPDLASTTTALMPGFEKEAFCFVKRFVFLGQFPGFL